MFVFILFEFSSTPKDSYFCIILQVIKNILIFCSPPKFLFSKVCFFKPLSDVIRPSGEINKS